MAKETHFLIFRPARGQTLEMADFSLAAGSFDLFVQRQIDLTDELVFTLSSTM